MSSSPSRALVVVDAQKEYARGPLRLRFPPLEDSLARVEQALTAAEAAGIPVVLVQHHGRPGGVVFDPQREGARLLPRVEALARPGWRRVVKHHASVYAGTGLDQWLTEQGVDTVTLVGYMTNNCVLASASAAESLGLATEVLSDATGAIRLSNAAGRADAQTVHTTLMALLHSSWAAVATTSQWVRALERGVVLPRSSLVASACSLPSR